jgi:hypothetical protein
MDEAAGARGAGFCNGVVPSSLVQGRIFMRSRVHEEAVAGAAASGLAAGAEGSGLVAGVAAGAGLSSPDQGSTFLMPLVQEDAGAGATGLSSPLQGMSFLRSWVQEALGTITSCIPCGGARAGSVEAAGAAGVLARTVSAIPGGGGMGGRGTFAAVPGGVGMSGRGMFAAVPDAGLGAGATAAGGRGGMAGVVLGVGAVMGDAGVDGAPFCTGPFASLPGQCR